jgi:hypothetical protein
MRLVRLVLGGIVLGAIGGYAAALLRPRTVHRNLVADLAGMDTAPLPERSGDPAVPDLEVADTVEVRR